MVTTPRRRPAGLHRARRGVAILLAALLLLGLVPAAAAGEPVGRAGSGPPPAASDPVGRIEPALLGQIQAAPGARYRVIVQRQPAATRAAARAQEAELEGAARTQGADPGRRLGLIDGHALTLTGRQVLALARHRLVRAISLDHAVQLHQVTTAPLGTSSPATTTTPAPPPLLSTWTQEANAPAAWSSDGARGAGVSVAVLDSGIQPGPDLSSVVFGADTATGTTALGDLGGHGTHVAGIIAGNGALSSGAYQGVAPGARLVSVKVTNDTGAASYSSVIGGLQWVVNNKDAYNIRVANLSLGATASAGYRDDPLDAAVEMAWFRGVVVVVSAGNAGPGGGTISVPGNDPFVITVGALDDAQTAAPADDVVPDWSSRGPTPVDGLAKPDLAASGRRVVSLRAPGSYLDALLPDRVTQTAYFRLSGTSMAAPVVSGVAALLIARNPSLRPDEVKAILTRSARPSPFPSSQVGAGAVDAQAALQLAAAGGYGRANVGIRANNKSAAALWRVIKSMPHPVWRHQGLWNGRYWADGGWDLSGFRTTDGGWDDGGWDTTAWDNFRWEDGGWDAANWLDGGWDTLTALNIALASGTWDSAAFAD